MYVFMKSMLSDMTGMHLQDCGALCYGYDEWNRTQEIVKDKGVVSLIRSSSLMHGRQKSSALIALDSIKVSIVRASFLRLDV